MRSLDRFRVGVQPYYELLAVEFARLKENLPFDK